MQRVDQRANARGHGPVDVECIGVNALYGFCLSEMWIGPICTEGIRNRATSWYKSSQKHNGKARFQWVWLISDSDMDILFLHRCNGWTSGHTREGTGLSTSSALGSSRNPTMRAAAKSTPLSHSKYSSISFGKSTPPHNRQFSIYYHQFNIKLTVWWGS